jgi:MFS family permease
MTMAKASETETKISITPLFLVAIFGVYFINSFVLGQWIPRVPDIKLHLGLDDQTLGICIFALPVGTLTSFIVASSIVQRLGLKVSCSLFQAAWALCFIIPGIADNLAIFILGLFLSGFAMGFIEVAINSKAADMERGFAKAIMSRCHGFWSVGAMLGALLGSLFAEYGITTGMHFLSVMPILALLGVGFAAILPMDTQGAEKNEHIIFRRPSKVILLLAALPLGIMATEGIYIDWSAIYMRDEFLTNPFTAGSVYVIFGCAMSISRLSGDFLSQKMGAVSLVFWSGIFGALGLAGFALAPSIIWVYIASTLCGLGVGNVYPQVISAASRCAGNPTDNVAAISLIEFLMFLFTPALIGFLSDSIGMRYAFLCYVPLASLAFLLAKKVDGQTSNEHQN